MSDKVEIDNPALFFFVLSLFLISISFIVVGLIKGGKVTNEEVEVIKKTETVIDENKQLSEYFEENFSRSDAGGVDVFLQDDPFRAECASSSGDDIPSTPYGTVCLR